MARKKGHDLYLFFILLLSPFLGVFWLYEKLGPVGILLLVIGIVAGIYASYRFLKAKEQLFFENIVRETLYNKPVPEADTANMRFFRKKKQYEREMFLREIQLVRDGVWLALNSKKPETAISRRELFTNSYQNLSKESSFVSKDLWEQISDFVLNAEEKFHTDYYINVSKGLMEKAEKLKTDKGKQKYWQEARDVLGQGIVAGKGNMASLKYALSKIP